MMHHERLRGPFQYYGGKGPMVAKLMALVPPGGMPYTACYAASRARMTAIRGPGAAKSLVPRTEVVWRNPKAASLLPYVPPGQDAQMPSLWDALDEDEDLEG